MRQLGRAGVAAEFGADQDLRVEHRLGAAELRLEGAWPAYGGRPARPAGWVRWRHRRRAPPAPTPVRARRAGGARGAAAAVVPDDDPPRSTGSRSRQTTARSPGFGRCPDRARAKAGEGIGIEPISRSGSWLGRASTSSVRATSVGVRLLAPAVRARAAPHAARRRRRRRRRRWRARAWRARAARPYSAGGRSRRCEADPHRVGGRRSSAPLTERRCAPVRGEADDGLDAGVEGVGGHELDRHGRDSVRRTACVRAAASSASAAAPPTAARTRPGWSRRAALQRASGQPRMRPRGWRRPRQGDHRRGVLGVRRLTVHLFLRFGIDVCELTRRRSPPCRRLRRSRPARATKRRAMRRTKRRTSSRFDAGMGAE